MTKEIWYRKVGRKYVPIVEAEKYDYQTMPAEGFTLTYRKAGLTQWEYEVKPDNASFVAAAMVSRKAMESAMTEAAKAHPQNDRQFTQKQLATINKYRDEIGGMFPAWWEGASSRDIAQAGIDALLGKA